MLIRQRVELNQLVVGDHVAGRVGWARYADHAGFRADMQMFEIHMIFKLAFRQQFDIGTRRDEQVVLQPGIRVADVFRCQREQHFFRRPVRLTASKQVKQVEKCALTAIC